MLAAVLFLTPCHAAQTPPSLSAKSAILMDADSGRVLLAQNADARSRIASTTKILTGLLVCEQMALEKTVRVPKEAVGLEGSSMYLTAGEQITGCCSGPEMTRQRHLPSSVTARRRVLPSA